MFHRDSDVKVAVIGAAGGVGLRLVRELAVHGIAVAGLHRRPEQAAKILRAGAEPISADLTAITEQDLADLISGADVLVFAAGAGGGSDEVTTATDGEGVSKSIAAAKLANIRRLILVSVFPEAWRERPRSESFEHYLAVKKKADVELAASDLDWVILRPAELTDEDGSGTVALSRAQVHTTVSRDNVAATLAGLIDRPEISRVVLELADGTIPICEALESV